MHIQVALLRKRSLALWARETVNIEMTLEHMTFKIFGASQDFATKLTREVLVSWMLFGSQEWLVKELRFWILVVGLHCEYRMIYYLSS